MEPSCATCKKTRTDAPDLKRCAKCQSTFYCSRECQKADWKVHKKECSAQGSTKSTQDSSAEPDSSPAPTFPPGVTFPTGAFLSPDTNTTNRKNFTAFFLSFPCPQNAHPMYKNIFITHQELVRKMVEHPAMAPNLEQTFSTPANSKNKVYFMWDFLLRTFQILVAKVDPIRPKSNDYFDEIMARASLAKAQILDETGKLNAMNASVGNAKYDKGIEFGEEIKELAKRLDDDKFPDYIKEAVAEKMS